MEDIDDKNEIQFLTPEDNDTADFKEFYNLSGYYLKLSHIKEELDITFYPFFK